MLIFIENTPRTYHWGLKEALPEMLGTESTGEPQAELWLGAHPDSPAQIAKATPVPQSLIDLIESDPERYGVEGGPLPFLLKVLAIGGPLSLQVHPDLDQARAGYAAEEAAGVPLDAPHRNYGDPNHKPELLVALSDVRALSGFRPLAEARRELRLLAAAARETGDADGAAALEAVVDRLAGHDHDAARRAFLCWVFSDDPAVARSLSAIEALISRCPLRFAAGAAAASDEDPEAATPEAAVPEPVIPEPAILREMDPRRLASLGELAASYPGDPGVLVSTLLHLLHLAPGEAIYLEARQLHAYLHGIAVEVMASSDNVLRAGLTRKHVDIAELCRIVDTGELARPLFSAERVVPGLIRWQPPVSDFQLLRARLHDPDAEEIEHGGECAPEVEIRVGEPLVLVVTAGRVRVERFDEELAEVVTARRGQSVYVSVGGSIRLTGEGEAFLATVGRVPIETG
ncbi:MAG: mannose-6-phosphate isomerase, class I [Leucobacter sp.]